MWIFLLARFESVKGHGGPHGSEGGPHPQLLTEEKANTEPGNKTRPQSVSCRTHSWEDEHARTPQLISEVRGKV